MSAVLDASGEEIRIGIVDDDTVLARSLALTFRRTAGFRVIGAAETLEEGVRLLESGVDVLLVDVGLPDGSGLDLIARARARSSCKILVISVFADGRTVVQAIERGADGYLLKGASAAEVLSGIRAVLAGGAPISPAVAGHILARVRDARAAPRSSMPASLAVSLTPREITILEQLAKGLSFKEVAGVENISPHTVADHVKAIYRKLAVNSRGEAVFEAIQAGLIDVRR